ncbi:VOC family protein [Thalassotalea piscium]
MQNQIVWADIPVTNLDRAIKFYTSLLQGQVTKQTFEQLTFAILPHSGTNVSACLIEQPQEHITDKGPLLYFNVDGRLKEAVELAKSFNVKILEEYTDMGPHGKRAVLHDSEGNRIALHSH